MLKKSLIFLSCFLSACSFTNPAPRCTTKPPLNIPDPAVMKFNPVTFKVVHKDNVQSVFSDMEKRKEEPVVFGLTGPQYKNLAINMQIIKSHILMQQKIIKQYKRYYGELPNDSKN
jgi:hypothetical protein